MTSALHFYKAGAAPPPLWPNASSTGPTGTLLKVGTDITSGTGWTSSGGNISVTANCTLTNLDVPGGFTLSGGTHQVVANNCWFRGIGAATGSFFTNFNGVGTSATNCRFGGGADGITIVPAVGAFAYGADVEAGCVFDHCQFTYCQHGVHMTGGVKLIAPYCDNILMGDPVNPGAHTEGVFISGGANNHIDGGWFRFGNGSTVFAQASAGLTLDSAVVENSYFAAITHLTQVSPFGLGFQAFDSSHNPSVPTPANIIIRNNTFDRGTWGVGPLEAPSGATLSNNVYADDGTAVPVTISTS